MFFTHIIVMVDKQVLGAFWYIFSVERQDKCWRIACGKHEQCHTNGLYCDVTRTEDYSFLNTSCPLLEQNQIKNPTDFDFGIFLDALQSQVVEKRNFWEKLFYCFWWGLRNLRFVLNSQTCTLYLKIKFVTLFYLFIQFGGTKP